MHVLQALRSRLHAAGLTAHYEPCMSMAAALAKQWLYPPKELRCFEGPNNCRLLLVCVQVRS